MVDVGTRKDSGSVVTPPDASAAGPTSGRAGRRPSRWVVRVAALAALLVALVVAGAVLLLHDLDAGRRPEQRQAALDTARRIATGLATINGANAQATIEGLIPDTTGPYHDHLTQHAGEIQAGLAAANTASGSVIGAGLETFDGDSASALVVVGSGIPGAHVVQQGPRPLRLSIQLQHVGERWLVSAVEVVP